MKGILVGLGGRARSWLKVCGENREVEWAAFVEPAEQNRKRAIAEWGLPKERIFDSLEAALQTPSADFVLDVTPPAAHEKVALAAFEAGLHVIGEKPLSDNLASARRVVEAGRKAHRRHMITQNYRFNAVPRTTRRLLQEGLIGQPGQADVAFYMAWADSPGSHYVTQPFMFLTDMGIHHFDMLRYVLGAEALRVQAVTWNLPWGWHQGDACHSILFHFSGGLIATHHAVGCTLGRKTTWNGDWRIEGPRGSLSWEGDRIFLTHDHRTEKKRREEVPPDPLESSGQAAVLAEFLSALKEDRDPECHAEDNLQSMKMVFGALKSAREKREIMLSDL